MISLFNQTDCSHRPPLPSIIRKPLSLEDLDIEFKAHKPTHIDQLAEVVENCSLTDSEQNRLNHLIQEKNEIMRGYQKFFQTWIQDLQEFEVIDLNLVEEKIEEYRNEIPDLVNKKLKNEIESLKNDIRNRLIAQRQLEVQAAQSGPSGRRRQREEDEEQ